MTVTKIFSVRGKVAFITGAAQGLGRAMAEALSENGANVTLFDCDETLLHQTAATLGPNALALPGDVTNRKQVETAIAVTIARFGALDIAIANAGVSDATPGKLHDLGDEDWTRVLDINLTGTLHTCRGALPQMLAQGTGKIITVASMWGLAAPAGAFPRPAYAASKGAVVNLTREMALHYAAQNIQINALCPGIFQPETRPRNPAAAIAYTPMSRLGRPDEIKGATLFLASAASDFVTGTSLVIDGGVLAR